MSLLFRYLLRNNLAIILPTLAVGTGIYLLTDLFDRLDNMLDAGTSFKMGVMYYVVKTPLIISQILPAVFLLAALIQLCIMSRERELVALQAGGVSFGSIARFFILYGMLWGCIQLGFSQVLGVAGENEASRIWQEHVRGRTETTRVLHNIWFSDGDYVVHLDSVTPAQAKGEGFSAYLLSNDTMHINEVIRAKSFASEGSTWMLHDVSLFTPKDFGHQKLASFALPLTQDIANFAVIDPRVEPQRLPLWQLGKALERLKASGSNVEALRTAWHMKLSYAASLVVMGLIAVALITWRDNVYLNITVALGCTFLFYAMFTVGGTMGEKGLVSPLVAAWGADVLVGSLALGRLFYVLKPPRRNEALQAQSLR